MFIADSFDTTAQDLSSSLFSRTFTGINISSQQIGGESVSRETSNQSSDRDVMIVISNQSSNRKKELFAHRRLLTTVKSSLLTFFLFNERLGEREAFFSEHYA